MLTAPDCAADGDAHDYAYRNPDTHADPHAHGNAYAHTHADPHAHGNAYAHTHADTGTATGARRAD